LNSLRPWQVHVSDLDVNVNVNVNDALLWAFVDLGGVRTVLFPQTERSPVNPL
jgi:hypothetical protein